jgi:hypothetical protein
MSIIDSVSEHFHEIAWPEHCEVCPQCRGKNPITDYSRLCLRGQDLAEWLQYT